MQDTGGGVDVADDKQTQTIQSARVNFIMSAQTETQAAVPKDYVQFIGS